MNQKSNCVLFLFDIVCSAEKAGCHYSQYGWQGTSQSEATLYHKAHHSMALDSFYCTLNVIQLIVHKIYTRCNVRDSKSLQSFKHDIVVLQKIFALVKGYILYTCCWYHPETKMGNYYSIALPTLGMYTKLPERPCGSGNGSC